MHDELQIEKKKEKNNKNECVNEKKLPGAGCKETTALSHHSCLVLVCALSIHSGDRSVVWARQCCQCLVMIWCNGLQMCNKWWLICSQTERGGAIKKSTCFSTQNDNCSYQIMFYVDIHTWQTTCNYFWILWSHR